MQLQNNNLQQSYQAYPAAATNLRQNNSLSKIAQSMDTNQMKLKANNSMLSPNFQHNVSNIVTMKAADNKKRFLSDVKPRRGSIIGTSKANQKYLTNSRNQGKIGTIKHLANFKEETNKTRTEQGILKMVDKQISKGLKAAKK